MGRLAALVPKPRVNLTRFHGVFSPNSKLRKHVVPQQPTKQDGHQTRTFCYIIDAIEGFLRVLLLGKPGEAYNVGNDENEISMKDLARLFTVIEGNDAKYETIPYPDQYPGGEP